MSEKHFDVVVLGRSLGAMAVAALLARRDFGVLVVGHNSRPCEYQFRTHTLRRRTFLPLAATSPAFRRILSELAQYQAFRRRVVPLHPMLTVLCPGRRFELPPDMSLLETELDREFPEVRRVIDDLYADLTRLNAAADAAFERDLCWPPGTAWERHRTGMAASSLPYLGRSKPAPLADFPSRHPYVEIVEQSAYFGADFAPGARPLPPFALARLHGLWTRGPFGLPSGEDAMVRFLADRVVSFGGQVMLDERAVGLDASRGDTLQLFLDGAPATVGASFVVTDESGEALAQLAHGKGVLRKAQRQWPLVESKVGRFVASIVVHALALPEPLGPEALLFSRTPGSPPDPASPVVHLQSVSKLHTSEDGPRADGTALLLAEVLLPTPGTLPITEARRQVLDVLLTHLPFLEEHLLVVDSPYDGLPVWCYEQGRRVEVDRGETRHSLRGPEPMPSLFSVEPPGFCGIGGEPLRGPIPRTFLVGRSVLPALGQEGELLAAWSVARIITKSDRRKLRVRREMWSRFDMG